MDVTRTRELGKQSSTPSSDVPRSKGKEQVDVAGGGAGAGGGSVGGVVEGRGYTAVVRVRKLCKVGEGEWCMLAWVYGGGCG